MRAVATVARQQGTWGAQYAKRLLQWAEHLKRPRNGTSLAAQFFTWQDDSWLNARRRDPRIGGSDRPGTRAQSGFVFRRWDESLQQAQEYLLNSEEHAGTIDVSRPGAAHPPASSTGW